jgi:hypothetical protein
MTVSIQEKELPYDGSFLSSNRAINVVLSWLTQPALILTVTFTSNLLVLRGSVIV